MSFIVYALPRSRTAWLSRFLTYGDWTCGHDEARHLRGMADIESWFAQPNTGTVETAVAPFWRTVKPGVRVVVVRRPVAEVVESLMRLGPFDPERLTAHLGRLERKLEQIEHRVPGALSVSFAELASEDTCARVFEHCLPYKHDPKWWATISPVNIQVNLTAVLRHYVAHEPLLLKMASMVKCQTLVAFNRKAPHVVPEALTIRQEDLATFYRDGKHLFAEHLVLVDEAPGAYADKNYEFYEALEKSGALQIMTARSNGRMFGYLLTIIGPSLADRGQIIAVPNINFASPEFPGLGRQLRRASQAALRDRGVTEMELRAGVRGDGPRMGPVFERMGAEPNGQLYRLKL